MTIPGFKIHFYIAIEGLCMIKSVILIVYAYNLRHTESSRIPISRRVVTEFDTEDVWAETHENKRKQAQRSGGLIN